MSGDGSVQGGSLIVWLRADRSRFLKRRFMSSDFRSDFDYLSKSTL